MTISLAPGCVPNIGLRRRQLGAFNSKLAPLALTATASRLQPARTRNGRSWAAPMAANPALGPPSGLERDDSDLAVCAAVAAVLQKLFNGADQRGWHESVTSRTRS